MSWTHKESVDRFSDLLTDAKNMMNKFYKQKGVFEGKDVTSEELRIAILVMSIMGGNE